MSCNKLQQQSDCCCSYCCNRLSWCQHCPKCLHRLVW